VLVYGDTNSTLAGSLAAAKLHIPVAHVEAGLRSHNRKMPEEINRVLTDHVSALLLCPTETAVENLQREGVTKGVHLVGDVMYDALLHGVEIARRTSTILDRLAIEPQRFILATVHRAENTNQPQRLQVPCLTLRDETEWEETVQSGWNRLVGTDSHRISRAVEEVGPGSGAGWLWKKGEASRNVARLIGECRHA
jgi:UDP-N-acetylglucosamine 2-epimerase